MYMIHTCMNGKIYIQMHDSLWPRGREREFAGLRARGTVRESEREKEGEGERERKRERERERDLLD